MRIYSNNLMSKLSETFSGSALLSFVLLLVTLGLATISSFAESSNAGSIDSPDSVKVKKTERKVWVRTSARRCDFIVFSQADQSYDGSFGGADCRVRGALGTILSIDSGLALLHNGSTFVECRKGQANLSTKSFSLKLPSSSSVMIEVIPSENIEKIAYRPAESKTSLSVSVKKTKETILLSPNQQVLFLNGEAKITDINDNEFSLAAGANQQHTAPLHLLGAEASEFRCSEPNVVSLRVGQVFALVPDHLIVRTELGDVIADKGALIDVDTDSEVLRVKSLSQSGHASVDLLRDKLQVSPSEELVLSSRKLSDSDVFTADGIGRRRVEDIKMKSSINGIRCDFSMISFLHQCDHVAGVRRALNGDMKDLRERILKTASAVQIVTSKYGTYRASAKGVRKRNIRRRDSSA